MEISTDVFADVIYYAILLLFSYKLLSFVLIRIFQFTPLQLRLQSPRWIFFFFLDNPNLLNDILLFLVLLFYYLFSIIFAQLLLALSTTVIITNHYPNNVN